MVGGAKPRRRRVESSQWYGLPVVVFRPGNSARLEYQGIIVIVLSGQSLCISSGLNNVNLQPRRGGQTCMGHGRGPPTEANHQSRCRTDDEKTGPAHFALPFSGMD